MKKELFNKKQGFTLIELSIVLVIIGLIVGGILMGRTLIHTSELQAMLKERETYLTAVNTFKLKYNALPGDMNNATSYWTADTTCPWTRATQGSTCNGDGNGQIGPWGSVRYEMNLSWQHLSLAGMIPGRYTGELETGGALFLPDVRLPSSKNAPNAGWQFFYVGNTAVAIGMFAGTYSHVLTLSEAYINSTVQRGITPADQAWTDSKIDDGMPQTGIVRGSDASGWGQNGIRCVVFPADIYYAITTPTRDCGPLFLAGF